MSSLLYIQGLGYGVALPEMPYQGHSWPENLKETPEKWHPQHRQSGILDDSGPYE